MNIPGKVKIGKRSWTVKLVKGLNKKKHILGLCDSETYTILIDADQTPRSRQITFLHELLHAVFPNSKLCNATEEMIVEHLDEKLFEIFENNSLF